jgi:hypothetical protein
MSDTLTRHGLLDSLARTIWDDLASNGYLIVHMDDQEPNEADHTAACIGQLRRDVTTLARAQIESAMPHWVPRPSSPADTQKSLHEIVERGNP